MTYRIEYRLKPSSDISIIEIKTNSVTKALEAADYIINEQYGRHAIFLNVWSLELEEAWRVLEDEKQRAKQVN